jgi:GDP-D-mannose dehydratase
MKEVDVVADISKIKEELGWFPELKLEDLIDEMLCLDKSRS